MNYRLDIQYDGTRYEGWQRQKTTGNTIQGKIEEVLSRMLDAPVQIDGQHVANILFEKGTWIQRKTVRRSAHT